MNGRGRARFIGLLVTLGLVVAGCGGTPAPTPTPSADPWQDRGPIVFAVSKAQSAIWEGPVDSWNAGHPNELVTLLELPDDNGASIATRAEAGSGEYTVMALDVNWTPEFASKGWLAELPSGRFPTEGMVPAAVDTGTYEGRLYAYPQSVDATVLHYRKDLLDAAKEKAPTTWDGVQATCAKVLTGATDTSCYAGQYGTADGLTTSYLSGLLSAGGQLVASDGTPAVDSAESAEVLDRITAGLAAGTIPRAATGWSEPRARQEFDAGRLVFFQDWWANAPLTSGDGPRTAVAPVPGPSGPGVAVLGGRNLGIAAQATNKGTAADFVNYLVTRKVQAQLAEQGWSAPVLSALYTDDEVLKAAPSLAVLAEALKTAEPFPGSVHAREAVRVIDETLRPALTGERPTAEVLDRLQAQLEQLLK